MENKFTFQGHTFDEEKQVILAKKEAEAIEYLRSKTDFNSVNQLMKLYNRILDKNMMETVIGIEFLNEIRSQLLRSGMFTEEQIRPLPLLPEARKMKKRADDQKRSRERILLEHAEKQNRILKIVCFFLSILVIAIFHLSGNLVPTKRGIALTEQQWESFLSHRLDIEKLLDLVKNDEKTELPKDVETKELF